MYGLYINDQLMEVGRTERSVARKYIMAVYGEKYLPLFARLEKEYELEDVVEYIYFEHYGPANPYTAKETDEWTQDLEDAQRKMESEDVTIVKIRRDRSAPDGYACAE